MTIETMDRAAVKQIGEALEVAVQMVADDLGLDVQLNGGRFDPTVGTFAPKVEFSVGGAEEREFAQLAPLFGLTPEHYGAEFTSRGTKYRLVGLAPRRPKYPGIGERADGRRYKFTEDVLANIAAS